MPGARGSETAPVFRYSGGRLSPLARDELAVEEPLEIRVAYGPSDQRRRRSVAVTMRTPGHDRELAAGFLLTEGVVRDPAGVAAVRRCGRKSPPDGRRNVVCVGLRPGVAFDPARLRRHFYTASSCGICGKASLDALRMACPPRLPADGPALDPAVIHRLPALLYPAQEVFGRTGGLHAAGLFDPAGNLLAVREDVGRHNAVDKLIGAELLAGRLPLSDRILLVSGRASFELAQKALMAGIPVLAAVGAPSSLAVDLSRRFDLTLAGFVRADRYNIYSGAWRLRGPNPGAGPGAGRAPAPTALSPTPPAGAPT